MEGTARKARKRLAQAVKDWWSPRAMVAGGGLYMSLSRWGLIPQVCSCPMAGCHVSFAHTGRYACTVAAVHCHVCVCQFMPVSEGVHAHMHFCLCICAGFCDKRTCLIITDRQPHHSLAQLCTRPLTSHQFLLQLAAHCLPCAHCKV